MCSAFNDETHFFVIVLQLVNMCFELYMLATSGTMDLDKYVQNKSKKKFTFNHFLSLIIDTWILCIVYCSKTEHRSYEIITAVVTLCQNVYFFFTVSLNAAFVGEEAEKGAELLRRHALSPTSTVHEKYLVRQKTNHQNNLV